MYLFCFKVALNGEHFCEFKHRLSKDRVNELSIAGDIELASVVFQGPGSDVDLQKPGSQVDLQSRGSQVNLQEPGSQVNLANKDDSSVTNLIQSFS